MDLGKEDPISVFEWCELYGDEFGYSPDFIDGTPTNAPAGSREKVRVIKERADKGLVLWHPWDDSSQLYSSVVNDSIKSPLSQSAPQISDYTVTQYETLGSRVSGAIVGQHARQSHRFAIWDTIGPPTHPKRPTLYVTATVGWDDRWDQGELARIREHAVKSGKVSEVIVCSLFTARQEKVNLATYSDLITIASDRVFRMMTNRVSRVVLCYGRTHEGCRHADLLRIAKKDTKNSVFVTGVTHWKGLPWPRKIPKDPTGEMVPFPSKTVLDQFNVTQEPKDD